MDIKSYLTDAYSDTQAFRVLYKALWKYRDNGYDDEPYNPKGETNMLRSQFCLEAEDIFDKGIKFPDFRVDAVNINDKKSEEDQSITDSLLRWMVRMTGFEAAYNESKTESIVSGDAYRRPFMQSMSNGKWFPQYEDIDPTELILDIDSTDIWSETSGRGSSWIARARVCSRGQAIMKFGEELVNMAQENVAAVDVDRMNEKITAGGTESKDKEYYEYIELQDISAPVEVVFLGGGMMPVIKHGKLKGLENKFKKLRGIDGISWSNKYKHLDKFGNPMITTNAQPFDYNRFNVRDRGIVSRLMRFQDAEQMMLNGGLEASMLRMTQIPWIKGVNGPTAQERIAEWKEERKVDPLAILDISGQGSGNEPDIGSLKFDGISQDDTDKSLNTIRTTARNYNGVDFNRLEVRSNEGLGQTKILEAERVESIEKVAERAARKLQHELEGLLLYAINHNGFDLHDTLIPCTLYHKIENPETGEVIEVQNPKASLSIPEACKRIKDLDFNVYVDMDTIVNKRMLSLLDDLTKFMGGIDGAAQPELKKELQKRAFNALGTNVNDKIFDGVEDETAQGGVSQFQDNKQTQ